MLSRMRLPLAPRVALLLLPSVLPFVAACHRGARPVPAAAEAPPAPLPAALHGAALPDALDDRTFWQLVGDLSEPGGYFRSENFVSNEMGLQEVVSRLRPVLPPGGVYLGVGPEQNFTYLAALRPRIAFIVDIRRQNLLQHLLYKAMFEASPTRATFLSRLFARRLPVTTRADLPADSLVALLERTPPDSLFFREVWRDVERRLVRTHGFTLDTSALTTLRYVDSVFYAQGPSLNYSSGQSGGFGGGPRWMPTFAQIASATDETGRNIGFLGSEAAYAVVRDLQRRNLVVPVTGNFAGPKALRAVGGWLRERNARVGAFYVSNVEQYLFRQGDDWSRFYANVATLPLDGDSRFIRSCSTSMCRGLSRAGSSSGGMMMTQLLSPVAPIVEASRTGTLMGYLDLLGRSSN